jgi:predicted ATPase
VLGDKRFLRSIKPTNILSFGPDTPRLELLSLNVLIGPNGSGKSNLIEVISLLQAAPKNLLQPIQTGGGIAEWIWKGLKPATAADIDTTVSYPGGAMPLRHVLELMMVGQRAELAGESIHDELGSADLKTGLYYHFHSGGAPQLVSVRMDAIEGGGRAVRPLRREDLSLDQSVLSQRKDSDHYPEVTYLGNEYARIKLFREWSFGRYAPPRRPQQTDLPSDFLSENADNLALVLNDLERHSNVKIGLVEKLKQADEAIENFSTIVQGGTVQLYLHYSGLRSPVPATRLSDGTIRYLCLLSILCHPSPPPLVCIEEPELGLHPDLLPGLADLLVEASHRMQLIVTTHSDVLVDGLTKVPEAIVVCEKRHGSTEMKRMTATELAKWLKDDYGLGQLWRSGEIGGNRW